MKIVSYYDADGKYLFCGTEGGFAGQPRAGEYEGFVTIGRQYHDFATGKPANRPPQPSAAHRFDYKRKAWVANAESAEDLRGDDLFISQAFVDEGVTLRRIRPRAKGSASRINKRAAHITVVVEPKGTKGA